MTEKLIGGITMISAFSYKDFSRNQDKVGKLTPCCICGKGIQDLNKAKWLRVSTANKFVMPDAVLEPGEDMGSFPIGPECLRKNPELREYTH